MSPSSAPSDDAVAQFLNILRDPANEPVFAHCEGGHDRTGALTAIYRMIHGGWTADRAYAEMKQYGYGGDIVGSALEEFVFNYARRLAPQKQSGGSVGVEGLRARLFDDGARRPRHRSRSSRPPSHPRRAHHHVSAASAAAETPL